MNIAILGGSFDPITIGHIDICNYVLESDHNIDAIWILPIYKSMSGKKLSNGLHRIEMIKLACSNNPKIILCDFEIKYKLNDTSGENIKKLINKYPLNNFSYIIGMDVANNAEKWNDFQYQLNIIPFIVIPRDGIVQTSKWFNNYPHKYIENNKIKIHKTSSTKFKNLYQNNNKNCCEIINKTVFDYIIINNLY